MSLKKHGLKINMDDLRDVAKNYRKQFESDSSFILYYDKSTGDMWVNEYTNCRSYTQYDNTDIIFVFRFGGCEKLSQQKIIDYILLAIYSDENTAPEGKFIDPCCNTAKHFCKIFGRYPAFEQIVKFKTIKD